MAGEQHNPDDAASGQQDRHQEVEQAEPGRGIVQTVHQDRQHPARHQPEIALRAPAGKEEPDPDSGGDGIDRMPPGSDREPDHGHQDHVLRGGDVQQILDEGESQPDEASVDDGVGHGGDLGAPPAAGDQCQQEQALAALFGERGEDRGLHKTRRFTEEPGQDLVAQQDQKQRDPAAPQKRSGQPPRWFWLPPVRVQQQRASDEGTQPR